MELLSQISYRAAIKDLLQARKREFGRKYSYDNLALACHITKVYLSRALNGKAQLNLDQIAHAADFLGLDPKEAEYLELIYLLESTQSRSRKIRIQEKIEAIIREKSQSNTALNPSVILVKKEDNDFELFLRPVLQIVLVLMSIKRFAKDPKLACSFLQLDPHELEQSLKTLLKKGYLIRTNDNGYMPTQKSFHLNPDSSYFGGYREAHQINILKHYSSISDSDKYNFNVVFAADEELRRKIRGKLLEVIQFCQSKSSSCPLEEVYQMSFTLFSWTRG